MPTTDQEWLEKYNAAIAGKTGMDLTNAKREIYKSIAAVHPDEYAWTNGDRKKPTGDAYIASKIIQDMKRIFGPAYDDSLGRPAAEFAARMYY